jgi:hypothetical protein
VAQRTPEQQRAVARAHRMGRERERAARSVFSPGVGPRLALLRDAAVCFVAAVALDDDAGADVAAMGPEEAWERLDALVERGTVAKPPADVAAARRWLAASRPLEEPEAPGEQEDAIAAAFASVRWLARCVDPRTPAAVRRQGMLRRAALAVGVAVLLASGLAMALAPVNIALDKPVSASSIPEGSTRRPAGLTNGRVELTCGAETKHDGSPWFAVDLGAPQAIDRVVVYNRGDGDPAESLPLALEVGDSLTSFETVATRTDAFTRTRPWTAAGLHRTARFVRVRKTTSGTLALAEIEIYR